MKHTKKRIFTLILTFALLLAAIPSPTYAATQITVDRVATYGFKITNGSNYVWNAMAENDKASTSVLKFYANGSEIGSAALMVIRGRSKTVTAGSYDDVMLVRTQMAPKAKKNADGATYTGLSDYCKVSMDLNSGQKYVNAFPKASEPDVATTKNFSINLAGDKSTAAATVSYGNTTTKSEAGLDTLNHCDAGRGQYRLEYDYLPRTSTKGSTLAACKLVNKWLTNTHNAYYAMAYTTPKANTPIMRISYNVKFKYAVTSGTFDGTPSKIKSQLTLNKSLNVNYAGSGSNY